MHSRPEPPVRRVLFLDDDPRRAEIFLAENPQAVWVETVTACVTRLLEHWDEVHLDHDLGGQQMVGSENVDCGMEVIRWLCKEPRKHLRSTLFFVHTHNLVAGFLMVMQIRTARLHSRIPAIRARPGKILAHNEPENGKVEESGVPKHWIWAGSTGRGSGRLASAWPGARASPTNRNEPAAASMRGCQSPWCDVSFRSGKLWAEVVGRLHSWSGRRTVVENSHHRRRRVHRLAPLRAFPGRR